MGTTNYTYNLPSHSPVSPLSIRHSLASWLYRARVQYVEGYYSDVILCTYRMGETSLKVQGVDPNQTTPTTKVKDSPINSNQFSVLLNFYFTKFLFCVNLNRGGKKSL